MSKSKLLVVIIVVVLALAGAYFLWSRGNLPSLNLGSQNSENQGDASAPASDQSADMSEIYTSPDYGFSFKYPKGFNTTELSDDSGDTVLVQSAEEKSGFQIYITPFDEPEPLTGARILEDLPASEVIDPKDVLIGEGKTINAVIFLSTNPSFGKTREVWFLRDGFLYQVTTYEGQDEFIGPILETFRFE